MVKNHIPLFSLLLQLGADDEMPPLHSQNPKNMNITEKKAHINLNNQQTGNHVNDLIIKSKSMIQSRSSVDILVKSENLGH